MQKLLFWGACLVALAWQPVKAQTGGAEVVVMSVRTLGMNRVRVVLAYTGGRTEEQIVRNMGNTDKAQDEATADYHRIIAALYQQGYSLKSTSSLGTGDGTTLVFVKGQ